MAPRGRGRREPPEQATRTVAVPCTDGSSGSGAWGRPLPPPWTPVGAARQARRPVAAGAADVCRWRVAGRPARGGRRRVGMPGGGSGRSCGPRFLCTAVATGSADWRLSRGAGARSRKGCGGGRGGRRVTFHVHGLRAKRHAPRAVRPVAVNRRGRRAAWRSRLSDTPCRGATAAAEGGGHIARLMRGRPPAAGRRPVALPPRGRLPAEDGDARGVRRAAAASRRRVEPSSEQWSS